MKCCFLGSRLVDEWHIENEIFETIINRNLVEKGFCEFIMGQRGAFDHAALKACHRLKKIYPKIKIRVSMISYNSFIKDEDGHVDAVDFYGDVDTFLYDVSDVYYKARITKANQLMIDESDLLICCADLNDITSGARKGVLYAIKKKKEIINLFNYY